MTEDAHKLSHLSLKEKEYVTYGDNNKGRILGGDKVGASIFHINRRCPIWRRTKEHPS